MDIASPHSGPAGIEPREGAPGPDPVTADVSNSVAARCSNTDSFQLGLARHGTGATRWRSLYLEAADRATRSGRWPNVNATRHNIHVGHDECRLCCLATDRRDWPAEVWTM